ncbi:hypothetical protein [Butyrivibrio sp. FCS014]|uniref:hypothetical protein n=1 Tax=Butyrivibrio sp. FCS014 TaxID=1408304 RepID=UPI000466BFC4|nr:hypothetical protein [Butyrivibrio sp. FCS014]
MAADRVGVNGDASVFWNNSYMASATKVEYGYDPETGETYTVNTPGYTKITMKLGLGAQEKKGVTSDNLSAFEANNTDVVNNQFSTNMYTLEKSFGPLGYGGNIIANETTEKDLGTCDQPLTEIRLRIQKNNTGYFVSYLDGNDNVISQKKFYDTEALSKTGFRKCLHRILCVQKREGDI